MCRKGGALSAVPPASSRLRPARSPVSLAPPCPSPPRVVVVIPAYNEERFIGSLLMKTLNLVHEVIVVDDGSSDGTHLLAQQAGARVIRHPQNQGKGAALKTGFRAALAADPDAVVMMDADGQHRPEDLPQLVAPVLAGRADIVIGSRYLGRLSRVPHHRVWGHRAFNLFLRLTAGLGSSDSQSGFRAFSSPALHALALRSNGFSVESEMQFIASELRLRVVEAPVTILYPDRPKRPVWRHALMVINGILRFGGQYRPLCFFGIPGALVVLAGMGLGLAVINIYRNSHQLAVGYAMISILLAMSGMILVSTGVILHSVRGLLIDYLQKQSAKP